MNPDTATGPAPGWYPDPGMPGQARWWDGRGWSSHVRLGTPPPVPQPQRRSAVVAPASDAFARMAEAASHNTPTGPLPHIAVATLPRPAASRAPRSGGVLVGVGLAILGLGVGVWAWGDLGGFVPLAQLVAASPGVEQTLVESIESIEGVRVAAVDCPDDAGADADTSFRCTVTLADDSSFEIDAYLAVDRDSVVWSRAAP